MTALLRASATMAAMSDPLASSPMSWNRAGVAGIQINYEGRPVSIVRGAVADSTLARLQTAGDGEAQQILAGLMNGKVGKRR